MRNSFDFEKNENEIENASKEDNELRKKVINQRKNYEIREIQSALKYHSKGYSLRETDKIFNLPFTIVLGLVQKKDSYLV